MTRTASGKAASSIEKVAFRLKRDEDGFPPADWEHLWADSVGENLFRLDNTPFFAHGVSYGDIVSVLREDEMNVFEEVVHRSGHGTVRVILRDPDSADDFLVGISGLDCRVEVSHIPGYLAIDVTSSSISAGVLHYLDRGEAVGHWQYEVSAWPA